MNRKEKTENVILITAIAIFASLIGLCIVLAIYGNKYTEHEYQLTEIQDGVYGTYSTVVSSMPAQNYDIITLCCNGNIRTFKGTVYITYIDGNAYATHKDANIVNADEIYVYVPFGTIVYQGTTGISSRR